MLWLLCNFGKEVVLIVGLDFVDSGVVMIFDVDG